LKKKKLVLGITLALVFYVLSGCSASPEAEKGNYIIAKAEQRILVAKDISRNDAEKKTFADFKRSKVELVNYIVEDAQLYKELMIGDKVNVTPKTDDNGLYVVMQSDPPQIVAGKIERQKH
jgi:predicted NUDIX family phosphoesterase